MQFLKHLLCTLANSFSSIFKLKSFYLITMWSRYSYTCVKINMFKKCDSYHGKLVAGGNWTLGNLIFFSPFWIFSVEEIQHLIPSGVSEDAELCFLRGEKHTGQMSSLPKKGRAIGAPPFFQLWERHSWAGRGGVKTCLKKKVRSSLFKFGGLNQINGFF